MNLLFLKEQKMQYNCLCVLPNEDFDLRLH